MTLADKLKDLRLKKGLLQKDVAYAVGISIVMISQYESGNKKPGRETTKKLADFFGVTVDYLIDDNTTQIATKLTTKDRNDVAKNLEKLMLELQDEKSSPLCYGGEMSDTDKELLRSALGNALEILKIKNKEKYTPKKYK